MIASLTKLVFSNPTISLLAAGLIASLISLCFKKKPLGKVAIVEALVAYATLLGEVGPDMRDRKRAFPRIREYRTRLTGPLRFLVRFDFARVGLGA